MSKALEVLLNAALWLLDKLRGPLSVTVLGFCYQDLDACAGRGFAVVSPWRRQYCAEVSLTNRTERTVYVDSMVLTLGGDSTRRPAPRDDALRLDAHERKDHVVVFPIEVGETPVTSGTFTIEVAPTAGRKTVVRGEFPLGV